MSGPISGNRAARFFPVFNPFALRELTKTGISRCYSPPDFNKRFYLFGQLLGTVTLEYSTPLFSGLTHSTATVRPVAGCHFSLDNGFTEMIPFEKITFTKSSISSLDNTNNPTKKNIIKMGSSFIIKMIDDDGLKKVTIRRSKVDSSIAGSDDNPLSSAFDSFGEFVADSDVSGTSSVYTLTPSGSGYYKYFIRLTDKNNNVSFYYTEIEKSYLAYAKLFDTLFDNVENLSSRWIAYQLRPLRLMLLSNLIEMNY